MAKLTLDVPDEMATALEVLGRKQEQTAEEYGAAFLERHLGQWSRQLAHFHGLIREGEESGDPIPMDDAYFELLKARALERFEARQNVVAEVKQRAAEKQRLADKQAITPTAKAS